MMIVREPDDMPEAKFSLRNTVQCESTWLANINTGTFVTGGRYSSEMTTLIFTDSTNDIPARVWRRQGERYAYCNIVEVDRYDVGSSWP